MTDRTYKLVFEGKVQPKQSPDQVRKKLGALLKADARGIERLFSGEPKVIKKAKDKETALKYKAAIEKAGAVCRIEADPPEPDEHAAPAPPAAPTPPEEMIACPSCHYRQRPSAKCIMCGIPLTDPLPAAPGQTPPAPVRTPVRNPVPAGEIMLTNIQFIPGRTIVEHYGLVAGSTIRAKHIGRDIMASLKNLIGGELKGYTQLLVESREEAVNRMLAQARELGANAVINVRFSTSSLAQGAAELYAYGTAVRVE